MRVTTVVSHLPHSSRGGNKKAFFGKAMLSPSKIMLTSPQSMKKCIKVIWVADSCCY